MSDELATRQFQLEQAQVDALYALLDNAVVKYRREQKAAAARNVTTHQNRTERDVLAAHYGDLAQKLEQVENKLVFGKINTVQGEARYIGRVGLQDEKTGQQRLIDWRAGAAVPFYQATAVNPLGLAARRHLGLKDRRVVSIEDEIFDLESAQTQGLELQGEGALIAALQRARTSHMGDIVATIQAQQDQIIRSNARQMVIIQGGPGTGKTAVALHRAAYLLYDQAERVRKNGVLILGPSPAFLRYIEQVLPSLGENGTFSHTLGTLYPGLRCEKHETNPALSALKGHLAWEKVAKNLVRSLERIPLRTQKFRVGSVEIHLTPDMARIASHKARSSGKPHNAAREIFVKSLLEQLTDDYFASEKRNPQEVPADERAWTREDIRTHLGVRRAINLLWMPYNAPDLLRRFLARPALLQKYARPLKTVNRNYVELLTRSSSEPFTCDDVPILDELAELLGEFNPRPSQESAQRRLREAEHALAAQALESQNLGAGMVSAEDLVRRAHGSEDSAAQTYTRERVFAHIVVDEAQELSPLAWRMLLRKCPSRSFTVVGDLAQQTVHRADTWKQLLADAAEAIEEEHVLEICYRTPQEIMSLAQRLCALHASPCAYPVRSVRQDPDSLHVRICPALSTLEKTDFAAAGQELESAPGPLTALKRELESELNLALAHLDKLCGPNEGKLALIVPAEAEKFLRRALGYLGEPLKERVSVLRPELSKGLEFDSVLVACPEILFRSSVGDAFVALTRATQQLTLLSARSLPKNWLGEE